jgi:radical SAM protein with 4Fe4S-binding SPASM domain
MAFTTQKHLIVYVKTTETCNLNCAHCFTSGINGRKIYFDADKTAKWCNELDDGSNRIHFEYHGGEPLLAPMKDLWHFYNVTKDHWGDKCTHGITTNLTYKLTDERIEFLKILDSGSIGTSWDPNIRFANEKQRKLWEDNVKLLVAEGCYIQCFISVSKDVVAMDPLEIADYMYSLGIGTISYERLTHDGNATINTEIFPHNSELDAFWMKMHETTKDHPIENNFLNSVYDKFSKGQFFNGTFCRDCEQKIHTINADGTVAGCPNTAPTQWYGDISMPAKEVRLSPKRMEIISCETHDRDPRCYDCPVFIYCHSDCHQLQWMEDVCPAPKTLMLKLAGDKGWI